MHRLALLPLAVLLACAGSARAQSNPYTIGVSETVSRISNLYNAADGDPRNIDVTRYSTAVFGSVNQTIGRQGLFGNVNLSHNKFSGVSNLDNNGYSLTAGWNFSTVERLAGSLQVNAGRSLAPFYGLAGIVNQQGNIQTYRSALANARLGLVTRLGLESSLSWREVKQSNPISQLGDYQQQSGSLGLNYRFSGALQASAGVSASTTDYSAVTTVQGISFPADTANGRNFYIASTYVPNGISSFSGRISVGRTRYEKRPQLNLDGVTGSLNYRWQATGKLGFGANYSRDTGTQLAFVPVLSNLPLEGQSVTTTDVSRVVTSYGVQADYAVTGKVSARAGLNQYRRTLVNTATNGTSKDDGVGWNAGVTWAATRTGSLGCSIASSKRETFNRDFSTSTFSCFGQIALNL